MEPVTFILTSSNRFDLLCQTIDSFMAVNEYPISKFIINEDSGNKECANKILKRYGDYMHVLFHPKREGLSKAIDTLIRNVDTEYVFTCEDDWLFENNRNFISESLNILLSNPHIHQVWIRKNTDHAHPLGEPFELNGIKVRDVLKGYQGHWGGFTFNPSLRRMSDIRNMFPMGFSLFGDEALCSKHVERIGYDAVSLVNHACKHIGWGRHTENFKV